MCKMVKLIRSVVMRINGVKAGLDATFVRRTRFLSNFRSSFNYARGIAGASLRATQKKLVPTHACW